MRWCDMCFYRMMNNCGRISWRIKQEYNDDHDKWMTMMIDDDCSNDIPVVPHKAVAEVSKIGNLYEKLVVVNQGWQSEATDGRKGA